jgi:hypothetical protein
LQRLGLTPVKEVAILFLGLRLSCAVFIAAANSLSELIKPLFNVSRQNDVENFFTIFDGGIHNFVFLRVRQTLFHGSMQSPYNFQQMLIHFFRVRRWLWHMISFIAYM